MGRKMEIGIPIFAPNATADQSTLATRGAARWRRAVRICPSATISPLAYSESRPLCREQTPVRTLLRYSHLPIAWQLTPKRRAASAWLRPHTSNRAREGPARASAIKAFGEGVKPYAFMPMCGEYLLGCFFRRKLLACRDPIHVSVLNLAHPCVNRNRIPTTDCGREIVASLKAFLDMCREDRIEPRRQFSDRFNVRIPPELHADIAAAAAAEGKSLNQWVADELRASVAGSG